jgi:CBS domain containing-hemolysin-like protein
MLIEEFNELFSVSLHDENYNTIGGYVMGRLERMPKVGDTVQVQGVRLSVEAMDALRIDQVGVYGRAPALEPDGS